MSEAKRARLDLIDKSLGLDEAPIFDVRALLLDPGGGLKKREAEGFLVLTNRRLIFGTAKHGILVDLPMKGVKGPATVAHKYMTARLFIETDTGKVHTLVLNNSAARGIALAVNKAISA